MFILFAEKQALVVDSSDFVNAVNYRTPIGSLLSTQKSCRQPFIIELLTEYTQ